MTKYEMLYILDSALADEAKEAIIKKFEDLVVNNGGVVEKTDRWGVKKLQYPISPIWTRLLHSDFRKNEERYRCPSCP